MVEWSPLRRLGFDPQEGRSQPQNISTAQGVKWYQCRGGSRIWLRGGPNFFWPIFANFMQLSHVNEVSPYWQGPRARLRALEALGFFITKYAFSPFLGTFLYYF